VNAADEDALYGALDWLRARQDAIEQRLAKRHLQAGGRVLYDLSSSYFEGVSCPLAARGYSRDGKKGRLQVNYPKRSSSPRNRGGLAGVGSHPVRSKGRLRRCG
jgi:hypothetical protein